jgi:hypothetical protein
VRSIPIERKNKMSLEEISREHLQGVGKPVIITDAIESWPALTRWTFDFWKTNYGSEFVQAWYFGIDDVAKLTKLSNYIDFLQRPLPDLSGFWVDKGGNPLPVAPELPTSPPYLSSWHAFQNHPELYHDILPHPHCVPDFVCTLNPNLKEIFEQTSGIAYWVVHMGPEGSLSSLHQDYGSTHAYLAQIRGRKHAILFSPEDSDFLYGGQVDLEDRDHQQHPLLNFARAYECIIEPGDLLLIPKKWWHHVRGLEKSITVSHNFFNHTNFTEYMAHILRNLPTLIERIDLSPAWRHALGIKWRISKA